MIPSKYRIPSIVAGITLAVALASVAGFLLYSRRPAISVTLAARVDSRTRAELTDSLAAYGAQQSRFSASLLPEGSSAPADIILGPFSEGGLVWRSQGWRLWARLETLAGIEGDLMRPLIRPLREGKVDGAALETLLADVHTGGIPSLILPAAPPSFALALDQYLGKLGWNAAEKRAEWSAKGWLLRVGDQRQAVEAIRDGKAAFLLGSDSIALLLGRSSDNHPEDFALPGSLGPGASWVIGRADAFSFPVGKRPKAGALDLVTYLTSKGLARRFAEKLPGLYYSWTVAPAKGKLPLVPGPSELLDPGK